MHACWQAGPMAIRAMRPLADVPHAGAILRDDVYGWFERVERGMYALTPIGRAAVDADRGWTRTRASRGSGESAQDR